MGNCPSQDLIILSESEQSGRRSKLTHKTAPLFLYKPIKTATHSFFCLNGGFCPRMGHSIGGLSAHRENCSSLIYTIEPKLQVLPALKKHRLISSRYLLRFAYSQIYPGNDRHSFTPGFMGRKPPITWPALYVRNFTNFHVTGSKVPFVELWPLLS